MYFGEYTDSKGRIITTWKGSFQGGNGGSSSESVVFTENLVLTEKFGRYYANGNQYTIECKNHTLDWLIKDAFIKASTGTSPNLSISTNFSYTPAFSDGYVERGTKITISWTAPTKTLTDYQYGSTLKNSITASNGTTYNESTITYSGDTTASSYSTTLSNLGSTASKTISVQATASDVYAKTNTGDVVKVNDFSDSYQVSSKTYTAFQYIYYKQFNDDTDVSSTIFSGSTIRTNYNTISDKVKSKTNYPSTFSITFEEGRKDFVLFIPNDLSIKSIDCITEANVPYDIVKKGTTVTLTNNTTDMKYDIFYYHLSGQLGQQGSVKFDFTLKK